MQFRGIYTIVLAALIAVAAVIVSTSAHADVPAPGDFSPAIWSDKADYSPGEHVVLSGANWQPGESVHITVNDDAGSTWSRSVDVTADGMGAITDEFDLPAWFVAQYSVRAEGSSGSVAVYTFTDGNVTFTSDLVPSTTSFTVTYSHWTNDSCTGTPDQTGLTFVSNGANNLTVSGSNESIQPTGATASGSTFLFFADPGTPTTPLTTAQLCQSGKGNRTYFTHFTSANTAPVINRTNASVSISEGSQASNSGTWSDANAGDTVTLTASVGTVVKAGTNSSGTWTWTYTPSDGPTSPSPQVVTITADDGTTTSSTTFNLTVNNVAPTVTAPASQSANEGSSTSFDVGSFTDPGADSPWAVDIDWGDASTHTTFNQTTTGTITAQSHTYADGPATRTVSVKVTDKNGGTDTKTFSVTVNNVAPTVTLSAGNDLTVSEGSTVHTYSYTISDPGVDTVSAVTTSCGANGTKVASSDTNTNTTGSFQCRFPDGPASSTVSASATDSDGATGNLATQAVTVNNVAPAVSLTGATNVDEGSTHTYTFTVTDPGQDTFTVDAGFPDCDAGATNNGTLVSGSLTTNAGGGSFDCTFPDGPATADVKVKVTDSDNASTSASESVDVVSIANVAPTVTAPADQVANEGAVTSLDLGSFSDPGTSDDPWSVDVDWGDGSTHTTFTKNTAGSLGSQSHTYDDGPATRTVSVTVTDKNNGTNTKTFKVTVNNVAPTVTLAAGNDQTVNEGSTHTYSYAISDPGVDTVSAVTTSCGARGTKGAESQTNTSGSFQCTFPDGDQTSVVSASATDSDTATGNLATQTVTIDNVAPTVSAASGQGAGEGSSASIDLGSFTDPGTADNPWHVTVDWGDGTSSTGFDTSSTGGLGSKSHTYADNGSYTVSVTVTDKDSETGSASFAVTVANAAPDVTAATGQSSNEGESKSFTIGSFSDAGAGDSPWKVKVDWGDSTTATEFTTNAQGSLASKSHTYADNGTYTVSVGVTDKDGDSDSATFTVTVSNVAPDFTAAAGQTALEGTSKSFLLGSFTDPGTGDGPWKVKVEWGDGTTDTTFDATSVGALDPRSHAYADNGVYTVKVTVTDKDHASDTDQFDVTVANVDPTVVAATEQFPNEGENHSFDIGSFTDPGVDDGAWSVKVDWGDGGDATEFTTSSQGPLDPQSHTYANDDTYLVTVTVTDNDGGSDSASFAVTVLNVAPVVTPAASQTTNEGAAHSFSLGSFTDPGADTPWHVDVDWGDGSTHTTFDASSPASLPSKTHTYADGPNEYTVTVKVTESGASAESGTASFKVKVDNVPPDVTAPAGQTALEGTSTSIALGSFADPGPDAPWSVDVDWGDGTSAPTTTTNSTGSLGSLNHSFADNGTYTVTVTVTDEDTSSDTATFTVEVSNVDPVVTAAADQHATEGTAASIDLGSFSDPGADDPWTVDVDWGDTSSETITAHATGGLDSLDHTYADNGPFTVTVKVTDKDGGSDTKSFKVTVANADPVVTQAAGQGSDEGESKSFSIGSFSDPGAGDNPWKVKVDWGDNTDPTEFSTGSQGTLDPRSHAYADNGTYTVTVTVTDKDGGSGSASFTIVVANVDPTVTLSDANVLTVNEGSTHTYAFTVTDPGADTFEPVDGYPDCDSAGSHGSYVADSYTQTEHGGSFQCFFPDGPSQANVKIKVVDDDGGSGVDSESVQVVSVLNAAPKVTAPADQAADEGTTASFDLGSFADDGAGDGPWHVKVDWGDGSTEQTLDDSANVGSLGSTSHSYDDNGTYTVNVTVTDKDGGSGSASFAAKVKNVPPTVTLADGNAQSVDEGSTHTYSYAISDPGADTVDHVTTSCGDNGVKGTESNTDTEGSFTCTFPDGDATSTVSVSATDSDLETGDPDTQAIAVHNVAPIVTLGANDLSVNEGSSHTYTFAISDPGQDTIDSVTVDCGTAGTKVGTATHTDTTGSFECSFPDGPASSIVSASATDSDGAAGTSGTQTVAVANLAPTVIVTGDDTATEGTIHTYSFAVTDAGKDTFSAADGYPDCDSNGSNGTLVDGSYQAAESGGTFQCSFPDGPKSANVKMKVVDSDGAADSDSENVQVVASIANADPVVTAGANQNASEGVNTSIDLGSFTDQGVNDAAWTVDVDWGDGTPHTSFTTSTTGAIGPKDHTYADGPATKTVTVKVTDKDGGSDSKTFDVSVKNVAPTATLSNNGPIDEGGSATISFTAASDVAPDASAGFHYEYHCDGGTFGTAADYASAGTSSTTSCSYADNGTKTVRARIIDRDGGAHEYTTDVTVYNAPPAITAPADQTANEGASKSFSLGSFSDAGVSDGPWAVDVAWGDASPHSTFNAATQTLGSQDHKYADNGTYTVTVKVTDKDHASDSKTFQVTVDNVAPHITSFTGTDYLVGANAFITGGQVRSQFTTNFTDPGADTWKADFTYQDGSPLLDPFPSFGDGQQTTHTFASAGCKTASVKVTDDDNGSDTATTTIHVGTGAFQPPMTNQPVTDKLKNGQTLPVKVHISDCSGVGAAGLTPAIRLIAGDSTPQTDNATATITVPNSVSAADTNGVMRSLGNGDYIYNMAVSLPKLNTNYTVIVYPFATGSPVVLGSVQLGHVIQATK